MPFAKPFSLCGVFASRGFARHIGGQRGEGGLGQGCTHVVFRFQHDGVDAADALPLWMRELVTVKNAFVSNVSAIEQSLIPLQRVDDIENGYVFWRPPQSKTAVDTLGRRDEPCFLQTGEQLRDVGRRDALELRKFTAAWLAPVERFDQMKQAVQTVFDTRSEKAQNDLRFC